MTPRRMAISARRRLSIAAAGGAESTTCWAGAAEANITTASAPVKRARAMSAPATGRSYRAESEDRRKGGDEEATASEGQAQGTELLHEPDHLGTEERDHDAAGGIGHTGASLFPDHDGQGGQDLATGGGPERQAADEGAHHCHHGGCEGACDGAAGHPL